MKHRTIIGVDPSFRQGGFWVAIVDRTEQSIVFRQFASVLHIDRWLQSPDAPAAALVCVENSNLQNVNFSKTGGARVIARKGRNVGTNQAASQLAVEAARDKYGPASVVELSPLEKGAKWTSRQFQAVLKQEHLTVYNLRDNQDARDAAKVLFIGESKAKRIALCG